MMFGNYLRINSRPTFLPRNKPRPLRAKRIRILHRKPGRLDRLKAKPAEMGEPRPKGNLLAFHDDLPKDSKLDQLRGQRMGRLEQRGGMREVLPLWLHEKALALPEGDDSTGFPPREAANGPQQLHLRKPGPFQHLGQPLLVQADVHQRDHARDSRPLRRERRLRPLEGAAGVRRAGDRPRKLPGAVHGRQPERGRPANVSLFV
jgi:hypothetical protein